MNSIEVTDAELDNLELRLKLLAVSGNASARTRRHATRLANQLRCLSSAMEDDIECRRVDGANRLRCDAWQAADAVPDPEPKK